MYLSLFFMSKRIDESQKAEEKQKFCIKCLGFVVVFFLSFTQLFLFFGRETHLNVALSSKWGMTTIHKATICSLTILEES